MLIEGEEGKVRGCRLWAHISPRLSGELGESKLNVSAVPARVPLEMMVYNG